MSVAQALPVIRLEMSKLKIPHAADKVYKDECMFSFDSPFSDTGLYLNLATLKGYGKDYLDKDRQSTGSKLYLHLKWDQVEKKSMDVAVDQEAPSKLAIGVAGGFMTEDSYDIVKEHSLVVFDGNDTIAIALPNQELPEFVSNVLQGVIDHNGMKSNMQVDQWNADNEKFVSKYAAGLEQTNPTGKKIPQDPKQWKCETTGATENLWLNLSTGFIGGGRKNWDGTGGSGSALEHYEATGRKYPLAVKLGTITPHGADVWSYASDEDAPVIDPQLAEHLSFWGIDAMKLEKTDKTMSEMEVHLNMSYDWSRILSDGEELQVVTGPGLLGLRNIGSSCYLNSVMQSFLSIPEVQERYLMQHEGIVHTSLADPSEDLTAQLSKLAVGVLSSRYVPPQQAAEDAARASSASAGEDGGKVANLEKFVLAPRMFKHLVGKGHAEFSSGRQQDVSEFFQYFLEVLGRAERVSLPRVALPGALAPVPTPSIFEYHVQVRYQCQQSGEVKYSPQGPATLYNLLDLPVPLDQAVPFTADSPAHTSAAKRARLESKHSEDSTDYKQDAKEGDSKDAKEDSKMDQDSTSEAEQFVPFEACLQAYLAAESVDMFSPAVGAVAPCSKTQRFQTFPRYLMVKMGRYFVGDNWVQQKINARIDVPEELDLSAYRGSGPQPDERLMSNDTPAASAAPSASSATTNTEAFVVDEGLVSTLVSMGFSENGCRRAAIATRNADPDTAMNWVFEHMEDPDFNDAPVMPSAEPAAGAATSAAGGAGTGPVVAAADPEAVAMLTSMGYTQEQVAAALQATSNNIERAADWLFSHAEDLDAAVAQVQGSASSNTTSSTAGVRADDGEGKYSLVGIISHLGKSTDHGHYVCHLKKDGQWVLFNDEKVGKCKKVPIEYGFMYLYRRNDGPGTFAV